MYAEVKRALEKHGAALLAKANVVAVGIGMKRIKGASTYQLAIICSVTEKKPLAELAKKDVVPTKVEDELTDVVQTGAIKALKARTDRWRPAPGGVSIGHEWITAGTLGCLVKKDGQTFILSNNHVLADSNNAPLGSAILQPGKHDGGTMIDRIATLEEFVEIKWAGGDGCKITNALAKALNLGAKAVRSKSRLQATSIQQVENYVDAALGRPVVKKDVDSLILEIGQIAGMNLDPVIGLEVQKSGRTTAVTKDKIDQVDVMTNVQYGDGKIALFVDQLMAGAMSSGGDSGSAVLDMDRRLMGLLFAGSDTVTVLNKIGHVWSLLDLDIL